MKIELHRGPELAREPRYLPAAVYNLAHTLLARGGDAVFVPIRSMQVLAIIDREEIVFVDSQRKHFVEAAWQCFAPRNRAALDAPVPYELVHYGKQSATLMSRLQAEFAHALQALAAKQPHHGEAAVLPMPPFGRGGE
ncbi:MAG: hypothetical protein IPJ21_03850 [Sterolibacteriaceae bacterium]|nr:hypothetical protein [Sterolibacteriaceae bacterium]MBK9086790.1 hypothetical protein [Sterolibacteriaceae bacterium]